MPKMSDKSATVLKFLDTAPAINPSLLPEVLPEGASCLLHMTDTHYGAIPEDYFVPVDMDASFVDTLKLFRKTNWEADACLATGDLVHEGNLCQLLCVKKVVSVGNGFVVFFRHVL